MTEKEALIAINTVSGIGSIKLKRLLEYFGQARKIFLASKEELIRVSGISDKIAVDIIKASGGKGLKEEEALIKKHNVQILSIQDDDYPANLKNIPDPPPVLYVKGEFLPQDDFAIAIVGSRRASFYGLSTAEDFAQKLGGAGISIVSGMARGIDTAAHRGAIKIKARTIAVLGSGLSNIYPPENKRLFEEISDNGAVISEFPMNTKPLAYNFPRRNRIISGLSLGVLVVEASRNSGALITVDNAIEQSREVFAVPGKVDSANSFGTNSLIKQGAKLVSNVEDIIEEIKPYLQNRIKEIEDKKPRENQSGLIIDLDLSNNESKLYGVISNTPKHIDDIVAEAGLNIDSTLSMLINMELRHIIRQLPGKLFVRENG
ncbi:MAG: DNA-protecting protein DprA [Candidatus Omnitrophica bacterium]|nr:DNA-protecting protein DprA [Candidatus Omnitrophota bacterium]